VLASALAIQPAPAADRAVASGAMDEAAFCAFHAQTAPALWAYLVHASGDRALADDLVQESFLRLLQSEFTPQSEEHRRRYLFRIASNLLTDHRRRSWRTAAAPVDELDLPVLEDRGLAQRRDVGRLLQELPQKERRLLWLAHVEEMEHKEIAGILGVRSGSVRVLLFRARQKLGALLRRSGLGPEGDV
jgi:RNA polymerase sigma-70 factor (ECF subfamily)